MPRGISYTSVHGMLWSITSVSRNLISEKRFRIRAQSPPALDVLRLRPCRYATRATAEIGDMQRALRAEIFTQPYESINWDAACNTVCDLDLYSPHTVSARQEICRCCLLSWVRSRACATGHSWIGRSRPAQVMCDGCDIIACPRPGLPNAAYPASCFAPVAFLMVVNRHVHWLSCRAENDGRAILAVPALRAVVPRLH